MNVIKSIICPNDSTVFVARNSSDLLMDRNYYKLIVGKDTFAKITNSDDVNADIAKVSIFKDHD